MKKYLKLIPIALLINFAIVPSVSAQTLKVAIAANLQPVMKALQSDFKKKTGITIDAISGSSGNLSNQIKNGAPYDIFMSADAAFPTMLYKQGFSQHQPVFYADGVLVICGINKTAVNNWPSAIQTVAVKKIAIGNPAIAPYGKVAKEALEKLNLFIKVQPKIVFGESISQVNTYITTGAVDAGFTTLSLIRDPSNKTKLNWALVDSKLYTPIRQAMILLRRAEGNKQAIRFYKYLTSSAAKAIFKSYGYHVN
ncbi:molybdate ABC transporter substrate-binding protein [Mucilaginibacter pallidiroseus]|uniref:Molybdate ABC transporter substrate-binding protein n=1 Tax=Mucilaginibacter pallidiroseus TaxID=2599295 RepID=A0A563UEN3_9SPHI|nr:molybdate ABC transporter substrate-binding protein [Mucilaginibacter pallidiroseus]TWR29766.1 molybdate ABC transporter substrate-binding protein [Mucilaginibacter pallidiroseus]